jgi:hypothetical protein
MKINEEEKKSKRESKLKRDQEIINNMEKLEVWKRDIVMRKEKKETVSFQY